MYLFFTALIFHLIICVVQIDPTTARLSETRLRLLFYFPVRR